MAQVTQQEFQAQQTATKLAEQKPVNTSFLDDMFGEGGFSLDEESGEMLFTPQQSETSNTEDVVASAPVSETQPEDSGAVSPDASEQRIASLESSFKSFQDTTTQILQQLVGRLNGQPQTQQEFEPEELDYSDPRSLTSLIEKTVEKSLSKVLGPLQQTQQKTEKYMEASETFNKYGQDFTEKIPVIKELMTVDTSLTFENAYLLAKRIEQHFPKSPANSNGNSQPTTQATKPASVLREKAEKLQTVNGVNPTGQVKPTKYNTVQAAFEAAMAEFEQGF